MLSSWRSIIDCFLAFSRYNTNSPQWVVVGQVDRLAVLSADKIKSNLRVFLETLADVDGDVAVRVEDTEQISSTHAVSCKIHIKGNRWSFARKLVANI